MEVIWMLKSNHCAFLLLEQMIVVGREAVMECMSHKCLSQSPVAIRATMGGGIFTLEDQARLDGHEHDWLIGHAAVIYLDCCWMVK